MDGINQSLQSQWVLHCPLSRLSTLFSFRVSGSGISISLVYSGYSLRTLHTVIIIIIILITFSLSLLSRPARTEANRIPPARKSKKGEKKASLSVRGQGPVPANQHSIHSALLSPTPRRWPQLRPDSPACCSASHRSFVDSLLNALPSEIGLQI